MQMVDLIEKKKRGMALDKEELQYLIDGYIEGKIPDYQVSALLMAIYFQGMKDRELVDMTEIMAKSGDMVDLSAIEGIKVDKHSTGGVGDKTTLIVAPIVAACGGKVAKMSGRGLGFTGGTVDKLESIPGYQTALDQKTFFSIVKKAGLSVMGQSGNIAPADKKLYALRDVTGIVDSIPLIAASIMSKKLAAGSDKIVLDVTVGSGAFMKNVDDAISLAEKMVAIGEGAGRETVAVITDMNEPLGSAVGNNLEVKEVIDVLQGEGPEDLREVCICLAANMLYLSGNGELTDMMKKASDTLKNGSALDKFCQMVSLHGGDVSYIENPDKFPKAEYSCDVLAEQDGTIISMDTELCGRVSGLLGAGREKLEDEIDYTAGIHFYKKTGSYVKKGEKLATLYSTSISELSSLSRKLLLAYSFSEKEEDAEQTASTLIIARITKNGVVRYIKD